jgi:hypothetical protein
VWRRRPHRRPKTAAAEVSKGANAVGGAIVGAVKPDDQGLKEIAGLVKQGA